MAEIINLGGYQGALLYGHCARFGDTGTCCWGRRRLESHISPGRVGGSNYRQLISTCGLKAVGTTHVFCARPDDSISTSRHLQGTGGFEAVTSSNTRSSSKRLCSLSLPTSASSSVCAFKSILALWEYWHGHGLGHLRRRISDRLWALSRMLVHIPAFVRRFLFSRRGSICMVTLVR